MKLLAKIGLVLFIAATLMTPVLEYFDRWDPTPGPMHDTEFALFAVLLLLCLVLLVAILLARASVAVELVTELIEYEPLRVRASSQAHVRVVFRPPPLEIPLRI